LNHAFLHLKKAIDLIENDTPFEDDNLGGVAANIAMAMEYEHANDLDIGSLTRAVKEGQKLGAMKMPEGWPLSCTCGSSYPCRIHVKKE
jgi:hypothetical protein